jgi:hypothetical protein
MGGDRYSPGVRELCCREASSSSFRQAAEDLGRVGQIRLSPETLRGVVEAEGGRVLAQQQQGSLGPEWTAEDSVVDGGERTCVITGADGVKVPLVTETEKSQRRRLRRRRGPRARRRRRRMARGSDQPYKEFKIVAFYDGAKQRQHAVGTSGDHRVLGKLMRREARKLRLDLADCAYSVTDGAPWILRQYRQQLPMLEANILDYYHLREHVIAASHRVFGEGAGEATAWRKEMMGVVLAEGPLALLDRVGELKRSLRAQGKRKALHQLREYVAKRMAMVDYPAFQAKGYEIGSGPTESFCRTLTARLKGPGMRWDKPNAEGIMALASIRSSGLWTAYWRRQRKPAA